jgi:cyclopropane fatty-acyl-phospholipid synthase-like methyltransferase
MKPWNERFAAPGFLFGTEPADFLVAQSAWLTPKAKALAVADGEGRNSVYMAQQGVAVTAIDSSHVAIEKAKGLAEARGVDIDFREVDVLAWDWPVAAYDLVVAIFIQFAGPDDRARLFALMKDALKPGGILMLHGYRPKQIEYGTGGPPHAENMYTEELLREAFSDMDILHLESYDREIQEGEGHAGLSALIDLVARKG